MAITEEQIKALLIKDVSAKTILVSAEQLESTISSYLEDGWELVNKVPLNGRFKVTFKKVKPAK